jgi:hypothetical protein
MARSRLYIAIIRVIVSPSRWIPAAPDTVVMAVDDWGDLPVSIEDRVAALEHRVRATEDQLEIMRLLATYGPAVDSGESTQAAQLWADDGVYDVGGVNRHQGQSAIAAIYDSQGHLDLINQGSGHMTMAPQLTLDGDKASAVAYSVVCLRGDDGFAVWRASANHWSLVRTASGWRIAERFNRVLDGTAASHDVLRRAVR